MRKHDGSGSVSHSSTRQPHTWGAHAALLCLSLLIVAVSFGCDTTPAPATPVAAASPTPASQELGTVQSVPTGAPSVTPTAASAATGAAPTSSTAATAVPTTPTAVRGIPAPVPTVADADAVIIYGLIAHDLVTQSQATTPATDVPPYIAINPLAGRGPMLNTDGATTKIPDDLIDDLADLDTTVTFANFADAVGPLDEGGKVQDDGIYLTLGELQPQGDADHIAAFASFYRANDDATGYRYIMERQPDGSWAIKDRQMVWDH